MNSQNNDYLYQPNITELANLVREERGIAVFVGAGCSAILSIPLWNDLLINLNEKFVYYPNKEAVKKDIIQSGPYTVASNIESKCDDKKEYKNTISSFLKPVTCHFTSLHVEIVSISKIIITTNYDEGFEETYKALHRFNTKDEIKYFSHGLGKLDYFEIGIKRKIFHIHGTSVNGELILTKESYLDNYKTNSGVTTFINAVFSNWSTVFIGFGFNDEYFLNFLEDSIKTLKEESIKFGNEPPKHFCIVSDNLFKDYLTENDFTLIEKNKRLDKKHIDYLINSNIIHEPIVNKNNQTVYKLYTNALENLNAKVYNPDSFEKKFLEPKIKSLLKNKGILDRINKMGINIIYFEDENYIQIEHILRKLNERQPITGDSFKPNN